MGSIYYKQGDRAILLLHSLMHTPKVMYYVANQLKKSGFTVYAPTFTGHDEEKIIDLLKVSVNDWIHDAREAIEFLKQEGYEDISVFGQSLGGIITLQLLLIDDTIKNGGIISTPSFCNWNYTEIRSEVRNRVYKDNDMNRVVDLSKEMQASQKKLERILNELNELVNKLYPSYNRIKQPVFIAHGELDSIVPYENSEKLNEVIPKSKLIIYNNAQHLLSIDRVNVNLSEDIIHFLVGID